MISICGDEVQVHLRPELLRPEHVETTKKTEASEASEASQRTCRPA